MVKLRNRTILASAIMMAVQPVSLLAGTRGEGDGDKVFTQADIDAAVLEQKKASDTDTEGLRTKNAELLTSAAAARAAAKKFEGIDVEGLTELKAKIENDEILSLLAEGKTSEAMDKNTERLRVTHQAALDESTTASNAFKERAEKSEAIVSKLLIDGAATTEFTLAKGIPEAAPDVINRIQQMFTVEDGIPVARGADNEMIQGEKGPLTIKEYINGLKKDAPHLFPNSSSANAGDGKGGEGGEVSDLDQQILDAVAANNFDLMRELRNKKKEAKKKVR